MKNFLFSAMFIVSAAAFGQEAVSMNDLIGEKWCINHDSSLLSSPDGEILGVAWLSESGSSFFYRTNTWFPSSAGDSLKHDGYYFISVDLLEVCEDPFPETIYMITPDSTVIFLPNGEKSYNVAGKYSSWGEELRWDGTFQKTFFFVVDVGVDYNDYQTGFPRRYEEFRKIPTRLLKLME